MDELRPDLSPIARSVLERGYLARDPDGQLVETPHELFCRVARVAAAQDLHYGRDPAAAEEVFFRLMSSLEFLPSSPALRNAGRASHQLAACFALPIEDSIDGVFDALKSAALVQANGGGTAFDFSPLAPAGRRVEERDAGGPLPYLDLFDAATKVLRPPSILRGANTGILRVDHPDIEAFIRAKRQPGRLAHFNLSVAVTDAFMTALAARQTIALRDPATGKTAGEKDAKTLFDLLVDSAWESGEPGAIFIDRIDSANPTPQLGHVTATHPCSEQPLLPFESCVLGSLDVSKFVRADGRWLDWKRLGEAVATAVHLLDNVIDASRFPLSRIGRLTRANRKVGVGVMGFADLLIALNVPYDSDQALAVADELMGFIERAAVSASSALARERGPFAHFIGSRWQRQGLPPMRNAALTTIAPTGTLSLLAGCSSGIEPVLAYSRGRALSGDERSLDVHPMLDRILTRHGVTGDVVYAEIARTGRVRGTPGVPEEAARVLPTAWDVAPEWHVKVQAVFQRHVDAAVSKTINLPASATRDDVSGAFALAWELGCKGITVCRDASRPGQPLTAGWHEDLLPVCYEPGEER